MRELRNKNKESFDEFLKRNFWKNHGTKGLLKDMKEIKEADDIIQKSVNKPKHDSFKATLKKLDIKYRNYSGKLDKTLDWLLPEDELSDLEEEKALKWVATYNQMKLDVLREVDDYKKNWKRFEKKHIRGSRKNNLEKNLLKASEEFLLALDYRDEFGVLGKNLKKAPVFIKYSVMILSVAYFAFFSVLFFPKTVVKVTGAIDRAVFGNIIKSGDVPQDSNFAAEDKDKIKPKLDKKAMSEFVKRNSKRLEYDKERGLPVINVSEEELFGQVAGAMEKSEDK